MSSSAARRLGQTVRAHGRGRRAALAHARRGHARGEGLSRSAAGRGSREVLGTELLGLDERQLLKRRVPAITWFVPGTTWWRLPSRVPSRVPRRVPRSVDVKPGTLRGTLEGTLRGTQ